MKTIQLTDEQYNALMQGESVTIEPPKPKIEKWQPRGGDWVIDAFGNVKLSTYMSSANFGTEYPTKEAAEKARDAMRSHNLLLAWLTENDDGWVADWSDINQRKYSLYILYVSNKKYYDFTSDWSCQDLSKVYMSRPNAEKICKLLNEGVVEL